MSKLLASLLCLAAVSAVATPARADAGARVGVSLDPDQVFVGFDADLGELAPRLSFRPGADIGFGDPDTLLALHADFVVHLAGRGRSFRPYLGVGPALNIFLGDDGDARAGIDFFGGLVHRGGFFVEVRLGALDSPDVRLAAGIRF